MTLKQATQKVTGVHGKDHVQLLTCSVDSVDIPSRSCMVTPLNGTFDSFPVQLMAEIDDGILIIPAEGSTVKVLFSDLNAPTAIQFSQIDKVLMISGDQTYSLMNGLQQFNDGSYGGIPIVKDPSDSDAGLLARLNKIEDDNKNLKTALQNLLAACTGMVTPSPGSPDPFSVAFAAQFSTYPSQPLVKTTEDQISNPNITQGKVN